MTNKQICYLFLMIVFSFAFNNNCCGQTAYVRFGNPPDCTGTGICAQSLAQQIGFAEVSFEVPVITPSPVQGGISTCTIYMKIYKRSTTTHLGKANRKILRKASRIPLSNTYTFSNANNITIPTSTIGGVLAQQFPNMYVVIPTGYTTAYVGNRFLGPFTITLTGLVISNNASILHTR